MMRSRRAFAASAFTLIELMVVIIIIAILTAILLPALSRARESAIASKMASQSAAAYAPAPAAGPSQESGNGQAADSSAFKPPPPHAFVTAFVAKVDLTPRLSVGTADPESIYEARFAARLQAHAPAQDSGQSTGGTAESKRCELHLPLPPQIISLADLSVTVDGRPADDVSIRDSALVWSGALPAAPTPVEITYTAVGKGLYALQTPPGRILDTFNLQLTANGSDIRMLDLSLQPTSHARSAGQTIYTWDYQRLMFGRPIQLDVLGIAPIDRLGELRWLGPLSVVGFGIIIGLYAHAYQLARFDRWMLLLVLGAFTGAYPLMYFAQEFVRLPLAISLSAGLVFGIIIIRSWAVIGFWHALRGVVLPAAITMMLALLAATQPQLRGLILTGSAILFFFIAMALLPRVNLTGATTPMPA